MNAYEAKRQARIDRYRAAADRARARSDAAMRTCNALLDPIPMGQPILVGHHSEKRHRRTLARADAAVRRAIDEGDKAKYYALRAAAAEDNNAISSDDPEAVQKLREKLAAMEERREHMKAVNAAWRRAGKPAPNDKDGWERVAEALAVDLESLGPVRLDMARFTFPQPWPSYAVTNLGANIRRVQERIKALEKSVDRQTTEAEVGAVQVVENVEDNRTQLFFPGKPAPDVRADLKSNGFRWCPTAGCWQRHLSGAATAIAQRIAMQATQETQP